MCSVPFVHTGYRLERSEAWSLKKNAFAVSVVCDEPAFNGTAVATACEKPGDDFKLSGCTAFCAVPATVPTGYFFFEAACCLKPHVELFEATSIFWFRGGDFFPQFEVTRGSFSWSVEVIRVVDHPNNFISWSSGQQLSHVSRVSSSFVLSNLQIRVRGACEGAASFLELVDGPRIRRGLARRA